MTLVAFEEDQLRVAHCPCWTVDGLAETDTLAGAGAGATGAGAGFSATTTGLAGQSALVLANDWFASSIAFFVSHGWQIA